MSRIVVADAQTHELDEEIPAGTEIVDGTPTAAVAELGQVGRVGQTDVGIWEMTPGTATDVEAEELFVVLSGRATVTFDSGERIDLRPGSVVSLSAGEHTTWTVEETLRKVYVALT